jgi:hypothetical protein
MILGHPAYEKMMQAEQALKDINEHNPIYIVGLSQHTALLLRVLAGTYKTISLFDDRYAGQVFEGHAINREDFNNMARAKKKSVVVIADTGSPLSAGEKREYADQGFVHVFGALEFLETYKIKRVYDTFVQYNALHVKGDDFPITEKNFWMCYEDWGLTADSAGSSMNNEYFVQDLWGARKVHAVRPAVHYDIGSMVNGFIAHLLAFEQEVVMLDIRPMETYGTKGISFIQADATNLDTIGSASLESLSALCSIEHFGLGRYGDPVDPTAHIRAMKSMQRVMKQGGNIYLSLPAARRNYLEFNAHRRYSPLWVIKQFDECELIEYSSTSPKGLIENAPMLALEVYHFGLYHFRKK